MVLKTVYLCIIVFSMVKTKNYQNGTIYQVVDIAYEQCYFGSTIDTLPNRFKGHKTTYQQYLNGNKRKYTSLFDMFDKFGIENCKIELVENYVCSSIAELHKREGYYIKNNDCINKNISGRSAKERYNDNPEPYKEKAKTITKTIKMGASKNTMTTSENICVKSNAVIIIAKKHTTKNNKKNIKRIMLTKSMRENLKRLPVIVVVSFHTDTKHSILEQRNTKTGSMNKMKNK